MLFELKLQFSQKIWLFKRSSPLTKKSVSGAQNNKVSEPRLFSVAINSLGIDADEVITEALP